MLDKQIEEINNLETAKQKFIARMEIIEKLQRSRPEIVHVFDEIVKTLPDGVYLTGVKQTDKKLKFEGVAQSSTRVSSFMRNIDGSAVAAQSGAGGGADDQGHRSGLELHAVLPSRSPTRCRMTAASAAARARPGAKASGGSTGVAQ